MRTDAGIGLYVHIPFCKRKCNYCDFASFVPANDFRRKYIDALVAEIKEYGKSDRRAVDTVFFGGGTPSLLLPEELSRIMEALRSAFWISPDSEITAEINPGTLNEGILDSFLHHGFNRFSVGLQSIHENELKNLGRIHGFEDFLNTYKLLRARGVKNISVDLMFGIPEQTKASFASTLDKIIELSPEHISVYGLILEEGTPFFDTRDKLPLPNEDEEREMYFLASRRLRAAGYLHYEISNFAKGGFECRHNLKYWRREEYIGVGLAAHSFLDGRRFSNSRDTESYFNKERSLEPLPEKEDESFEYAMLNLRTASGISLSEYKERFCKNFTDGKEEIINKHLSLGLIVLDGESLRLTPEGFYLSNTVLSDLLF